MRVDWTRVALGLVVIGELVVGVSWAEDREAGAADQTARGGFADDFKTDQPGRYLMTGTVARKTAGLCSRRTRKSPHCSRRDPSPARRSPFVSRRRSIRSFGLASTRAWEQRRPRSFAIGLQGAVLSELRILSIRTKSAGQSSETVVRRFPIAVPIDGTWRAEYNHGLIDVYRDERRIGSAEVDFPDLDVNGGFLLAGKATVECARWQMAPRSKAALLSAERRAANQRLMPEFRQHYRESTQLFEHLGAGPTPAPAVRTGTRPSGAAVTPDQETELARTAAACLAETEQVVRLADEIYGPQSSIALGFQFRRTQCLLQLSRFEEGLALHRQIVEITRARFGPRHPDSGRAWNNLAIAQSLAGKPREAVENATRAAEVFEEVFGEPNAELARLLLLKANALSALDELQEAGRTLDRALANYETLSGKQSAAVARALAVKMNLCRQRGDLAGTLQSGEAIAAIYRSIAGAQAPSTIDAERNVVSALVDLNTLGQALERARRLVAQLQAASAGAMDVALAEILTGSIYVRIGDTRRADEMYGAAYRRLINLDRSDSRVGHALWECGKHSLDSGDYPKGQQILEQVLSESRSRYGDSAELTLQVRRDRAYAAFNHGDLATAAQQLESVLEAQVAAFGETHASVVLTLIEMAQVEARQGQLDRAEQNYQRAVAICKNLYGSKANLATASAMRELGEIRRRRGDAKQGCDLCDKATQMVTDLFGLRHPQTAMAYDYAAGVFLLSGDWQAASDRYRFGLKVAVDYGSDVAGALSERQGIEYTLRLRKSRDSLLQMQQTVAKLGPALLARSVRTLPVIQPAEVYDSVWSTKAIVARALSRQRPPAGNDPKTQELWNQLTAVRRKIAQTTMASALADLPGSNPSPDISRLTARKEELQTALGTRLHSSETESRLVPPSAAELVRALPRGVAVVDFVLTQHNQSATDVKTADDDLTYAAFVLTKIPYLPGYDVTWLDLGPARTIDAAIDAWRKEILGTNSAGRSEAETSAASTSSPGDALAELVWRKLEKHFRGAHTVVMLPDGALARIPWAALPGAEPGTFLVEKYAIGTALYGQQLLESLERPPSRRSGMLLVGAVNYDAKVRASGNEVASIPLARKSWPELPGTRAEIESIGKLFSQPTNVRSLRDEQATKAALCDVLPKARYVHLATHGLFADPSYRSALNASVADVARFSEPLVAASASASPSPVWNPMALSGIVLAGANRPTGAAQDGAADDADGLLTAEEVDGLNLEETELVVLSACETGLGVVAGGEGVFGLQRAFHTAGADRRRQPVEGRR